MAITRLSEGSLALRLEILKDSPPSERRREFLWLLGASLLVAAGMILVLLAKTQDFTDQQGRLISGELLNVNSAFRPGEWTTVLRDVLSSERDVDLASKELEAFLAQNRPLPNVGALGRLRVSRRTIENDSEWNDWRARLSVTPKASPSLSILPVARLKPMLVVRTPQEFLWTYVRWMVVFLAAFWSVHLIWSWRKFRGDPAILPAMLLLTGVGLTLMVSLRDPLRDTLEFRKFAWGVIAGCVLLLLPVFKFFQYRNFERWVYTPLFVALGLFVALLGLGSGPTGSDARVNLGSIQPVELIKLLLVFFLAGYFARNWERLRELRQKNWVSRWLELPRAGHALPVMFAVASSLTFFFVLKDMGPALVMGILFLMIFALARRRATLALAGVVLLVGGVAIGYRLGVPHTVVERVSMWLSPWNNEVRGGDQLAHALWGFATGGVWGSGPGWGDPSVIPAGHTDLGLPSIAEEWGFPGVAAICVLFFVLITRAFRIALHAPDEYGLFLSAGCGTLISLEMLLISGGALGAIPLSGVVSPFLSSGNTAMLCNFLIFAVLLSVSNQSARSEVLEPRGAAEHAARFQQAFGKPLKAISAILCACAFALLARAGYIEIWKAPNLLAKDAMVFASDGVKRPEHNPRLNLLAASIPRGDIYDRNGILLATSSWQKIEKRQPDYQRLGVPIDANEEHNQKRYYPFGSATLSLLGDLRTGERFHASNASLVEHDSNQKLQGYRDFNDLAPAIRYRHQLASPTLQSLLHRDRDVRTTLDVRLQLKVEGILKQQLQRASKSGAALIMNAQTGDVLALVSWPPQSIGGADNFLDRARYGEYPPGSTFKLVTAMAALRLDPQAAGKIFFCRRLSDGRAGIVIPGWRRPIRDDVGDRVHGKLDMKEAITVSCNAYFAQLGVFSVGPKALLETAASLGIDAGTEAQVKATLPFAAYGQGSVVATPFQMARVAATIAEGGKMPQGRWVLDGSDGRTAPSIEIISPDAADFLAQTMRAVVTTGTARTVMSSLPIAVAGKTGTAQLDHGEPHSWFAGFAPADAPAAKRIAFAVIVEHGGYGAKVAAPIARQLVEAAAELGIIENSERR